MDRIKRVGQTNRTTWRGRSSAEEEEELRDNQRPKISGQPPTETHKPAGNHALVVTGRIHDSCNIIAPDSNGTVWLPRK